ncbi:hypothetical protein LXL04_020374 [Taraxacum kok-saghyz]
MLHMSFASIGFEGRDKRTRAAVQTCQHGRKDCRQAHGIERGAQSRVETGNCRFLKEKGLSCMVKNQQVNRWGPTDVVSGER